MSPPLSSVLNLFIGLNASNNRFFFLFFPGVYFLFHEFHVFALFLKRIDKGSDVKFWVI